MHQLQRIHAQHAQIDFLSVDEGVRGQFEHRAGRGHGRRLGNQGVKVFVHAALRRAHFQIALPTHGTRSLGKLAQRRGVDQVH